MKIQKRSNRFLSAVLAFGVVAGAVVGSALLSAPEASADDGVVTSGETEVRLNLLPVLSITTEDIELEITPTADGVYVSGTSNVTVDSNAEHGYSVYISTKTSESDLVNQSYNTYRINAVDQDYTVANFSTNTNVQNKWGYVHNVPAATQGDPDVPTISAIPYAPLLDCSDLDGDEYGECLQDNYDTTTATDPVSGDPTFTAPVLCSVAEGNLIDGNPSEECPLTIGVKADNTIAAGIYTNTIVLTAVPNLDNI